MYIEYIYMEITMKTVIKIDKFYRLGFCAKSESWEKIYKYKI